MNTDWKNIDAASLNNLTLGEAEKLFGLEPNFTEEELKKVRNALSRQYHPDLNPDSGNIMSKINAVYDILKNEIKNRRNAEQNNANGGATDTSSTSSDSTREEPEAENINDNAGATDNSTSENTADEPEVENLNDNAGATDNSTSENAADEPEVENLNDNAGTTDNSTSENTADEPEAENLNDNAGAANNEPRNENSNITWEDVNRIGVENLTLDDARRLFNLEEDFTENDLIDAYNRLDRIYNPMNFPIGSEEAEKNRATMNSIYGVYTILRRNLINRQNVQESPTREDTTNQSTQVSMNPTNEKADNSRNDNGDENSQNIPSADNEKNDGQTDRPKDAPTHNEKPALSTGPTVGDQIASNDTTPDPEPIPVIKSIPAKIMDHRKQILIIIGIIALAIAISQAINLTLVAQMARNGNLWHLTAGVAEKAALHAKNINLTSKLIALKSSYDSLSGVWTIAGQKLLTGNLQAILRGISAGSGILGLSCLTAGLIKKKSAAYKEYKKNIRQLIRDFNDLSYDEAINQINSLRENINNSNELSDREKQLLLNQLKKAEKLNRQFEDIDQGEELEGGMSL